MQRVCTLIRDQSAQGIEVEPFLGKHRRFQARRQAQGSWGRLFLCRDNKNEFLGLRGCTDTRRQGDISEKLDKLAQLIGLTQLLWRIVFPCAIVVLDQIEILGPTYLAQRLGARNQVSDVLVETRSEEHTSELQSLMRNSYAVFC